jgi:hypothetical protein
LKLLPDLMVKKPKYPAQKLTDEDKDILEQVVIKYAVKFHALTEKYPDAKKYAEKVILKKMLSNTNIAAIYTIGYAKNYPTDHLFRPGQINETLANDIRRTIPKDFMKFKSKDNEDHLKRFLHAPDLREVLKKLENQGIFIHLEGKKEIKLQEQHKTHRPGKKSSSDEVRGDDRGGKQSAYKVTEEVKKLKNAMEKPGAIDFLYEKLIKTGLAHKLEKFKMSACLHAAKMDETAAHKMMGAEASLMQDTIRQEDTINFKLLHQRLQSFDDNQIEQYADNIAKLLIEDRGYYALLSIAGLLKL